MKLTTLQERCLAIYFRLDLLVGDFITDEENNTILSTLSGVFLLTEEQKRELLELTQLDTIKAIKCESDYKLNKRIQEYLRLSGSKTNPTEGAVADIRGRAISALKEAGYSYVLDSTKPATYTFLTNNSQCGSIEAMRALGMLQLLGIFTPRDEFSGIRLLNRCAKWNDPDAILALLYFNQEREVNISRLYSVSNGTPFEIIFTTAKDAYGFDKVEPSSRTELIEQAIGLNIVASHSYSPHLARIVYSDIIEECDKIRLVLNNKAILGEINDLPLALKRIPLSATAPVGGVLKRDSEREGIIGSIVYSSEASALCPCIVTNDEFVAEDYAEMISKTFADANVIDVDARVLRSNDFSLDKNNVFVRDIDESRANIMLFIIRNVSDYVLIDLLSRFLKDTSRDDFRLSHPSITLNLSSVIPVCICDTTALKQIKHLCDCIEVKPISKDESEELIDALLEKRSVEYKVSGLTIADDAKALLISGFKCFADTANALDKLIYSFKGKKNGVITLEMVKRIADSTSKGSRLGF